MCSVVDCISEMCADQSCVLGVYSCHVSPSNELETPLLPVTETSGKCSNKGTHLTWNKETDGPLELGAGTIWNKDQWD